MEPIELAYHAWLHHSENLRRALRSGNGAAIAHYRLKCRMLKSRVMRMYEEQP